MFCEAAANSENYVQYVARFPGIIFQIPKAHSAAGIIFHNPCGHILYRQHLLGEQHEPV